MQSNAYISTPINTQTHKNITEFDTGQGWQKRARKLRERRWRKLAGRMTKAERDNYFNVRRIDEDDDY